MIWHTPVLTAEVVKFLECRSGGTYVDATLGGGGHAEAILSASGPDGRLIGFDRDDDALNEANERLKRFSGRFTAHKARFSELGAELEQCGIGSVDGVIADLGVSSYQLNTAERGFSFSRSGGLDMRMDRSDGRLASDVVNSEDESVLAKWFFEFGEERFSRRIASAIVREREKAPIETTERLAEIVERAVPPAARRGRIHPATRVFQALRIVVNDEMGELERLIDTAPKMLKPGGRFVVISYHSLEDRLVKHGFIRLAADGAFRRVTKKPVRPDEKEILENRRARSARLRVLERA